MVSKESMVSKVSKIKPKKKSMKTTLWRHKQNALTIWNILHCTKLNKMRDKLSIGDYSGKSHLLPSGSIKLSMSFSSSPRASLSIHSTFFDEDILSTGAHNVDTKHWARTSTIVIFIFLPTVVILLLFCLNLDALCLWLDSKNTYERLMRRKYIFKKLNSFCSILFVLSMENCLKAGCIL